ncbi:hypothetical protein PFISCL1PPCAC_25707, partial [Pristionchus fissidentatus]
LYRVIMAAPSAEFLARSHIIADKYEEVLEYFRRCGGNWLGQLLKTMGLLLKANFDRDNSMKHRQDVLNNYKDFLADPQFKEVAIRDSAFAVCLSFAAMFGAVMEEMNERTAESMSVLFCPANRASLVDPKAATSGDKKVVTRRRTIARSNQASAKAASQKELRMASVPRELPSEATEVADVAAMLLNNIPTAQPKSRQGAKARGEKRKASAVGEENEETKKAEKKERRRSTSATKSAATKTAAAAVAKEETTVAAPSIIDPLIEECFECGKVIKHAQMKIHLKTHDAQRKEVTDNDGALYSADEEPLVVKAPAKKAKKTKDDSMLEQSSMGEEEDEEPSKQLSEWMADALTTPVDCFKCKKAHASFKTLSNHLYRAHQGICREHYIFQCTGCDKRFRSSSGAVRHVQIALASNQIECKNKLRYAVEPPWKEPKKETKKEEEVAVAVPKT